MVPSVERTAVWASVEGRRGIFGLCGVGRADIGLLRDEPGQSLVLDLPRQSQHAVVMQRIGITDITINYHRPLVAGRKVWGGLVPYGEVWRSGANENTTITFSDPVTIEGKTLDRGTYGLHMIPTARRVDGDLFQEFDFVGSVYL